MDGENGTKEDLEEEKWSNEEKEDEEVEEQEEELRSFITAQGAWPENSNEVITKNRTNLRKEEK